ncbi:MAG: hypothetical protein IJY18_03350 [Clostridia bacterium]|nr:hypothetical protein [Clostridia bacterium]
MNDKDLKNKIKTSFASETPDLRSRIIESCKNDSREKDELKERVIVTNKKRRAPIYVKVASLVASFLIVFIIGAAVGNLLEFSAQDSGEDTELANVFIDVNPSIELQVNTENRVAACAPGNEDAKKILGDMNLIGTDIKTALNAVIGSMYMNGYLTSGANSMLVSVDASSEKFTGLLTNIVDNVNDIVQKSGITCSIVAQDVSKDEETETHAKENSVSLGKMSLINKIIEGLDDYSEKDRGELSKVAIGELNAIYAIMKEGEADKDEDNAEGETPEAPSKPESDGDKNESGKPPKDENDKDEDRKDPDMSPSGSDIISGVLDNLYTDKDKALELVLSYLSEKLGSDLLFSDIKENTVKVNYRPVRENGSFALKLIYEITVKIGSDQYELEIDPEAQTVKEKASFIPERDEDAHGTEQGENEDRSDHTPDNKDREEGVPTSPEHGEDQDPEDGEDIDRFTEKDRH